MYVGCAESSSTFFRSWLIRTRKYSRSLPYSDPQMEVSRRLWGTGRPACSIYLLKQGWEITSSKDHSLYPDHLTDDMEQDHVTTDDGQACVFTYLWPKLIEQRILADKTEFLADLTNEADDAHRIVLRNVVGNGLEIALDET